MDEIELKITRKDWTISMLLKQLHNSDFIANSTDKTNATKLITTEDYDLWVNEHLSKSATPISISKLQEIHSSKQEFLTDLQPHLSHNEFSFLEESLKSWAIPKSKLLVKDQKPPDAKRTYSTWLVILAMNFMVTFSKVGYLTLKALLDKI